jgi:signal transduction histidine kinase
MYQSIHRLLYPDGKYRWILNRGKIVEYSDDAKPLRMIGTHTDMTERVELEQKLQQLNADKDRFMQILAHDLRSPFTSIVGFSDVLVDQVTEKDYEGIEEYAKIIQQSSRHALELLMSLMEWAQSQTGKLEFNPERLDIIDLIRNITQVFDAIAGQKSILIQKELPRQVLVSVDKSMISTILRNLISNAIKFTKAEGIIIISAEEKPNQLIISIKDNGVGMSNVVVEKLFQINEFHSTLGTNNEKGTGLGLILCQEFVEKHGGKIWVQSEEGNGSTFYFSLPLS